METVELVIKLPKAFYKQLMENKERLYGSTIYNSVIDGVVLPKGHGRLIDADELIKDYGNPDIEILLENMDTIIKADKEVDK